MSKAHSKSHIKEPSSYRYSSAGLAIVRNLAKYFIKTPKNQSNFGLCSNENIRAIQLLLGHTKIDNTIRYLGIEIEDAIKIIERKRLLI